MMETKRLFYENVYQKEFDAEILFCGEDEKGYYVVLDQTVFYPEGGGQPADKGMLYPENAGEGPKLTTEGAESIMEGPECVTEGPESAPEGPEPTASASARSGGIAVLDVQYAGQDGEEIRHYIERWPRREVWHYEEQPRYGEVQHCVGHPLREGVRVHGVIDWARRFDLMQQHSGEHIVSGWIHKKYGYDNVGFHMGEDVITIDFNGLLDETQLLEAEREVNSYIWGNHPVRVFYPDEEERKALPYRSKKELTGEVRLVEFPGGDLCACCGLHVEASGEIGLVKLLSVKHFREGVRVEMVSGKRALGLLHQHWEENSRIAVALSVKPDGTLEAVRHLQDEIYALKGQISALRQEQFAMRARQCEGKGDILVLESHLDSADVRKEADMVLDTCGGICAVISLEGSQDGAGNDSKARYAIGQRDGDVRTLVKEMNEALAGKGGGKPFFAQGSLQADREKIETFFVRKGFAVMNHVSGV